MLADCEGEGHVRSVGSAHEAVHAVQTGPTRLYGSFVNCPRVLSGAAMVPRFLRRLHFLPGCRLNIDRGRLSMSFGSRGRWWTTGPAGRRCARLGWPSPHQPHKPAPSAWLGLAYLILIALGIWGLTWI